MLSACSGHECKWQKDAQCQFLLTTKEQLKHYFLPLKEGWLLGRGAFLHNSQSHGYFFRISSETDIKAN